MTLPIFPSFPGLAWPVTREQEWSSLIQESVSGKETRIGLWSRPRYHYQINLDVLRDFGAFTELAAIDGFYGQQQGQQNEWLFSDPSDRVALNQALAVASGVTQSFQLLRSRGGAVEPITDVETVASVQLTGDWQGNRSLGGGYRENLIVYSQSFSRTEWTKINATCVDNAATAPSGATTASTVTRIGAGAVELMQNVPLPSGALGDQMIFSVWVRSITLTGGITLRVRNFQETFEYNNTTTITSSWQRIQVSANLSGLASTGPLKLFISAGSTGTQFLVFGAQLERAASIGYYIPCNATLTAGPETVVTDGILQTIILPSAGSVITWSGTFYWRCRFEEEGLNTKRLMNGFAEAKNLKFRTIK